MGVNDDRLSPREHDDLRARLASGTHRIHPVGTHRRQWTAALVAVALVVGIGGVAITAANLLGTGAPDPVTTPTPTATGTPTPDPSPTPTPTATPTEQAPLAGGVVAFGGVCGNALTDAEVDSLRAAGMGAASIGWDPQWGSLLGGISCAWTSDDDYMGTVVSLDAWPADSVPEAVRESEASGCSDQPDSQRRDCVVAGDVGGVWLAVTVHGQADAFPEDGAQRMFDIAASRVGDYPQPRPTPRAAQWWQRASCEELVGSLDPAALNVQSVTVEPSPFAETAASSDISYLAGSASRCSLRLSNGDPNQDVVEFVILVPGGAAAVASARDGGGRTVDVPGATDAVLAPDLDPFDGGTPILVSTDGINALMIGGSFAGADDVEIALSSQLLAVLAG